MTFRVSTRRQATSAGLDGTIHVLESDAGDRADAAGAWVTGEFQGSRDDPASRDHWPADYVLRVTCRLLPGRLRVEAEVSNPDQVSLPFGLGYHPYFSVPLAPGGTADDCTVQV